MQITAGEARAASLLNRHVWFVGGGMAVEILVCGATRRTNARSDRDVYSIAPPLAATERDE